MFTSEVRLNTLSLEIEALWFLIHTQQYLKNNNVWRDTLFIKWGEIKVIIQK